MRILRMLKREAKAAGGWLFLALSWLLIAYGGLLLIAAFDGLALLFGLKGEAFPIVEMESSGQILWRLRSGRLEWRDKTEKDVYPPELTRWRMPDGNFRWFPNGVVPVCPDDC